MAIVAGFDVHRNQITFDALDTETGELSRGRIASTRDAVGGWVGRFPGQQVDVAVEACTGWLFVCEALAEAGAVPHLADPAEVAARRGKKRRAKTDRADARHLRQLLAEGRLPEAWLPPAHVCEWRTRTRLRKTLLDERSEWRQRIQATLFHHGVPAGSVPARLLSAEGRRVLAALPLPEAARERIQVALALIDAIDVQLAPLERELRALARRQAGCQALQRHFGVGPLTAPTILVELGDVTRLSASRKAVLNCSRAVRLRSRLLSEPRTRGRESMIRSKLTSLGLGLVLGVLIAATGASAGGGGALGHTYRYDLIQIVQGTVLSGGSDQATDATTHDTVTLTGSGQFKPGAGDATGGGTFVHRHAGGSEVAHGVWVATGFVSWQNLGGSLAGTGLTNGIAHSGDETAGILTLNVRLTPEGGGSPKNGVLEVHCDLPGASSPTEEGFVLKRGPFNFTQSGGFTVFNDLG